MNKIKKRFLLMFTSLLMVLHVFLPSQSLVASAQSSGGGANEEIQRRIIGYFCEWRDTDIGQNYTVHKIPWGKVTHINYAFADIGTDNKIKIMDEEAAIQRVYPGQDPSLPYLGHFNLLTTYKQQYPDTKTLISVGGWAASGRFYTMLDTQSQRNTFADSCVAFIRQYGFDGVDIDFEYPSSTPLCGNPLDFGVAEPRRAVIYANYVDMMRILREKLDAASAADGKQYLLTIAAPASSWILGGMQLGEYAQYLDFVNMMTYDFHGAWNGHVGPQAGLYPDPRDTETAGLVMPVLNAEWAYHYFRGVLPPEKINIGIPYYTRGWKNVTKGSLPGGLWGTAPSSGAGADGIDGIWNDPPPELPGGANPLYHIKNLLADKSLGYEYFWDNVSKTPYVWNEAKKTFLTFEDEYSMAEKCQFIIDRGIGGYLTWELSGDFAYDAQMGKYVSGDTLTTLAHNMFTSAPPLYPYQGIQPTDQQKANYEFKFSGNYDHPNYTYAFEIINKTGADIPAGITLAFDFPKSAILQTPWGATIQSAVDNGDFTRYTLQLPGWASIPNNGSYVLQGMIKLCFAGGPQNVQLNGLYSSKEFPNTGPGVPQAPVFTGVSNMTITVGSSFDPNAGVTATNPGFGPIPFTVTGSVNTAVAGTYTLTYSATSSQGLTTTVTRVITVQPNVVTPPVFAGVANATITVGTSFNPNAGVTATDAVDGAVPFTVTGSVNTAVAGAYTLTYSATNSQGATATATRVITVQPSSGGNAWSSTATYWAGDIVTYNGQTYRAKWWTLGDIPGADPWGPWELI